MSEDAPYLLRLLREERSDSDSDSNSDSDESDSDSEPGSESEDGVLYSERETKDIPMRMLTNYSFEMPGTGMVPFETLLEISPKSRPYAEGDVKATRYTSSSFKPLKRGGAFMRIRPCAASAEEEGYGYLHVYSVDEAGQCDG